MQQYFDDPQSQPNSAITGTLAYYFALTFASLAVAFMTLTGWLALGERVNISRRNLNKIEYFVAVFALILGIAAARTLWGLLRREQASWDWAQWVSLIGAGVGIMITSYAVLGATNATLHRDFLQSWAVVGAVLTTVSIAIYRWTTADSLYTPGRYLSIQLGASPSTGAIIGFVAIFLGFAMAADRFLLTESIANFLTRGSTRGIIAIAVTLLMISGEFDLSVGSILGVAGMTFILMLTEGFDTGIVNIPPQPVGVSITIALGFALLLGFINGLLMVATGIPSFIVTLGTLFAYRAITLVVVSEGRIIRYADYFNQDPIIYIDRWLLVAGPLLIAGAAAYAAYQALPALWQRFLHHFMNQSNNGSFGTLTAIVSALWALVITMLLGIVILWGIGAADVHRKQIDSLEGILYIVGFIVAVVAVFYASRFLSEAWGEFKDTRRLQSNLTHEELTRLSIVDRLANFVSDLLAYGYKVVGGLAGLLLSLAALILFISLLFEDRAGSMPISFFDLFNDKWTFNLEGVSRGLVSLNIPTTANFRNSIIWWVVLVVFFHIILTRTRYGNSVFAAGGNTGAARAQGINVTRIKVQGFMLTAFLAGIAAILETSRSPSVDPTEGTGWELETIAMTVVGGSLLSGGYGSVIGTMLGTLIFGMLATGLVLVSLPNRMFEGVIGVIMILAVILNNITKSRN